MKPELESLLEIILTDGVITEKERAVLQAKGEKLGISAAEVDVIIDAKMYEINLKNQKKDAEKDTTSKCPQCGEILIGISLVCQSCNYVITQEKGTDKSSVHNLLTQLENEVDEISNPPKVRLRKLVIRWYLLVFSFGIYAIYKKLIRRQKIFDRYEDFHKGIVERTDMLKNLIDGKYGTNDDIKAQVDHTIAVRDNIIKKRTRSGFINSFISFVASFAVIFTICYFATKDQVGPDGKVIKTVTTDSVQGIIKAGEPAKALMLYNKLEQYAKDPLLLEQIKKSEIDSLTKAKNYNLALQKANLLKDDYMNDEVDRKKVVDAIIEKEVTELIGENKFTKARQHLDMCSVLGRSGIEEKIDLAEKLYKEQHPTPTKRRRR